MAKGSCLLACRSDGYALRGRSAEMETRVACYIAGMEEACVWGEEKDRLEDVKEEGDGKWKGRNVKAEST